MGNKTKINWIAIIVLLSVTFLFTSCSTSSNGTKIGSNTNVDKLAESLRTGTLGTTMEFQSNMPPAQVYQGEEFSLGVLVSNRGASDIVDMQFLIGGYDPTFLDVKFKQLATSYGTKVGPKNTPNSAGIHQLLGKSVATPDGTKELVAFTVTPKKSSDGLTSLLPPGESYSPRFIATSCYQYKTNFGTSICIDPNYKDPLYAGTGCDMSAQSFSTGQGAPVAVIKVDPTLFAADTKKIVQYRIYFSNVGGGELFDNSDWTFNCDPQGKATSAKLSDALNVITVNVQLGTKSLSCYPSYGNSNSAATPINLQLGKNKNSEGDFIICNADISDVKSSYTSVLSVSAIYGYSQKASSSMIIKRSSEYVPTVDTTTATQIGDSGSSQNTISDTGPLPTAS